MNKETLARPVATLWLEKSQGFLQGRILMREFEVLRHEQLGEWRAADQERRTVASLRGQLEAAK